MSEVKIRTARIASQLYIQRHIALYRLLDLLRKFFFGNDLRNTAPDLVKLFVN